MNDSMIAMGVLVGVFVPLAAYSLLLARRPAGEAAQRGNPVVRALRRFAAAAAAAVAILAMQTLDWSLVNGTLYSFTAFLSAVGVTLFCIAVAIDMKNRGSEYSVKLRYRKYAVQEASYLALYAAVFAGVTQLPFQVTKRDIGFIITAALVIVICVYGETQKPFLLKLAASAIFFTAYYITRLVGLEDVSHALHRYFLTSVLFFCWDGAAYELGLVVFYIVGGKHVKGPRPNSKDMKALRKSPRR